MYKIMVVEDDLMIAKSVEKFLMQWGYTVGCIEDFKDILSTFKTLEPHIVLMDISLPFVNGYHWCSEIRKISKVPIVFISSASDDMNIVMAMNMGADDFIAKPFNLSVLSAKIGALIRRTYLFHENPNIIAHKNVMINLNNCTLRYGDKKLELTKNEFKILQILMENSNKVISRDDIMIHLWQSEHFIDDNTLTVNVTRLRKKMAEIGIENFIITKKNLGYMV